MFYLKKPSALGNVAGGTRNTKEGSGGLRAMKLYEFREMKGIDSLIPIEREVPKPGPGQVLVRVHAVSLNYRDLLIAEGKYIRGLKLPLIPCSDGAGEVADIGPGVSRVQQ